MARNLSSSWSASGMPLWYFETVCSQSLLLAFHIHSQTVHPLNTFSLLRQTLSWTEVILLQWFKQGAERRLWWSLAKQLILILHSQCYCPFRHGWGSFRTAVFFIHFYLFFHKPETCRRVKEGRGTQMCRFMVLWTHTNTFIKVAEHSEVTPRQRHSNWVTDHRGSQANLQFSERISGHKKSLYIYPRTSKQWS